MSDESTIPIRSFRNCFKLERRIHKIDRWQIPVPFGIPMRGVGYAVAAEVVLLFVAQLPVVGLAVGALSPPIRFGMLPIGIAFLLARWEIDGRSAHATLRSLVTMRSRPRRLVAWRALPAPGPTVLGAVTIAADDRGARLRPGVVRGPARVLVRYPFRARERWRTLRIEPQPGPPQWRGREITVDRGQRVVIR
jgi:hypothetical protein